MSEQKFDEVIKRLNVIVSDLEENKVTMEEAIELFQEGMSLVKEGEKRLNIFDKKIKDLIENVEE